MRVPLFGADVLNTACVVAVWVCGFLPMCFVCDYCDCVCVCVKRFCVCVCVPISDTPCPHLPFYFKAKFILQMPAVNFNKK